MGTASDHSGTTTMVSGRGEAGGDGAWGTPRAGCSPGGTERCQIGVVPALPPSSLAVLPQGGHLGAGRWWLPGQKLCGEEVLSHGHLKAPQSGG